MMSDRKAAPLRRFLTMAALLAAVAATAAAANAPVSKADRTLGNPHAPVVIIEYAAPTCPHCAHFYLEGLPTLKKEYIDKGKVFFVFRVFPLMPADGAVEAIAECLPRSKYFSFLELMYRNQSQWDPDGYDIPDVHAAIVKMAGRVGLSPAKTDACISDRRAMERINKMAEDGVAAYKLRAVPTFVVNGKVIEGYGGWPAMKAEIDALLAKRH